MYKAFVFRGGGVRGITYAGALQVAEQKGILQGINYVAGASAGAITAMLVAKRYSAAKIKSVVSSLSFSSFKDHGNPLGVAEYYGYFKGETAIDWLEEQSADGFKPNATFRDYRNAGFMDLRVVSSDYDTECEKIWSYDTTPDEIVSQAVRASMGIPLFFQATKVGSNEAYQCDGGTIMNYPIDLFDSEIDPSAVLGFYVTNFKQSPLSHLGTFDLPKAIIRVFNMCLNAQDRIIRKNADIMRRTVLIDGLSISATEFDLTDLDKTNLFNSGVSCTENYFLV